MNHVDKLPSLRAAAADVAAADSHVFQTPLAIPSDVHNYAQADQVQSRKAHLVIHKSGLLTSHGAVEIDVPV